MGINLDSTGAKVGLVIGGVVLGNGLYDVGCWAVSRLWGMTFGKPKALPATVPVTVTVNSTPAATAAPAAVGP